MRIGPVVYPEYWHSKESYTFKEVWEFEIHLLEPTKQDMLNEWDFLN